MLKAVLRRRLLATSAWLVPGTLLLGRRAAAASQGQGQGQGQGPGQGPGQGGPGSPGKSGSKRRNPASALSPTNPYFQPVGAPFTADEQASYGRSKKIVRDIDL